MGHLCIVLECQGRACFALTWIRHISVVTDGMTNVCYRHLERLRELNGLKILHDVQKYINE